VTAVGQEDGAPGVSGQIRFEVEAGAELATARYQVTRLSLVKCCGASGDFNVIHWNERIAKSVGLPNVIAHGMFTMAQAACYVTDWAGLRAAAELVVAPRLGTAGFGGQRRDKLASRAPCRP
jgi:acyl dehydratase